MLGLLEKINQAPLGQIVTELLENLENEIIYFGVSDGDAGLNSPSIFWKYEV